MRARIVGTHRQGFGPLPDGGGVLAFLREGRGDVELAVEVGRWNCDALDAVGRDVYKLRDVDGAVGGRGVVDQDGGGIPPLRVDVSEEHLGIGRAALGGEHQPAAVGGETVPGVHQRRIRAHAACLPALRRDDVELAVGAHQ